MALLDDISKAVTDRGKEAAQKAKDVAETVQLKAQISAEKSRVKSLYAAVGQLYYKRHKNDADGEYQSIIDEITKTLTQMAELQEKVRKLEGTVECPSCGAPVKKGNKFCGKCGAAVTGKKEEKKPETALLEDKKAETAESTEGAEAAAADPVAAESAEAAEAVEAVVPEAEESAL